LKSSARSALTKGSGSLTLVLIHPECIWAQEPCKECAGRVRSQGCEPEKNIERLLLQVCAESKVLRYLKVSEGCRKECVQGPSLKLEVVRNLRRDKSFEAIGGSIRSWSVLSDSRRQSFVSQVIKSGKESLVHFVNVSRRRRR
jgi:hypothetical protein